MLSPRVLAQLKSAGARLSEQVSLAGLTTLRVGGPAAVLAECATADAIVGTVRALDDAGVPTLLVAGGSNLLLPDDGFDGVVVRVADDTVSIDGTRLHVGAGAVWDSVVAKTVDAGLGGLECLSGIPGSAGATPVQNVGAYGVEVASTLRAVELLERATGAVRTVAPEELGLGYRTSVLKHSDHAVVLSVPFELRGDGSSAPLRYRELATTLSAAEGECRPVAEVRQAVLGLRRSKGMVLDAADHDTWSAGSFFMNPVVAEADFAAIQARVGDLTVPRYPAADGVKLAAGWLIERAGFAKGYPGESAAARLSTKHTLALTNRGSAKAADLLALAREVRDGVETAFGVKLLPEPVIVGAVL